MAKRKDKSKRRRKVRPDYFAPDPLPKERPGDVVVIEGTGRPHMRVMTQTHLDRYRARQLLDPQDKLNNDRLWLAGDQLHRDLAASALMADVKSWLSPKVSGGGKSGDGASAAKIAADYRVRGCMEAVGPWLWPLVAHVCGDHGPASDYRHRCRTISGAMMGLQIGLESVARYYRIGRGRAAQAGRESGAIGRKRAV